MYGPVLRGEKITLRPPTVADVPSRARWQADPEVARYAWPPTAWATSLEQLEQQYRTAAENREGVIWTIDLDGDAVGFIFINRINWLSRHGYTGYAIGERQHWGKGIASEALAMLIAFAFEELNLNKLKAEVAAEHAPSRRVLEKSGFRECGVFHDEFFVDGHYVDMVWFELLRRDWENARRVTR